MGRFGLFFFYYGGVAIGRFGLPKMMQAAEELVSVKPEFISDMEASNGSKMEIANVQARHVTDYGGYYFADIVMASKKSQPPPAPPDRCLFPVSRVCPLTAQLRACRHME